MELETISSISQIVGTATIVGGMVFGLIQLSELKKQRRDAVAAELMHTFMGAELANALTILRGLPDGASADDLRRHGPDAEKAAVLPPSQLSTKKLTVDNATSVGVPLK